MAQKIFKCSGNDNRYLQKYTATIETEKGNIVLELFAADVPKQSITSCF